MPPQVSTVTDKLSGSSEAGGRRSMRVLLSVPILVSGKTASGEHFEEDTRTLVVNAHGALISLAAQVVAGQQITVANKSTNKAQECRIVYSSSGTAISDAALNGQSERQAGKMQTGIEFATPSAGFWQIDFPPDDWVVPEN